MVLADVQTVTGAKTFGTIGGAVAKFILAGSTSGSTIVNAAAVADSTTMTFPGTSGTVVVIGLANQLTNTELTSGAFAKITGVGTIASGTWEGDVVASGFLDADTAHLTTTQTFTGAKTFNENITMATASILSATAVETGTVSANDGTLAITIADSTGVSTFVSGAVLVAPVLGTPASGDLANCTGLVDAGIAAGAEVAVAKLADGALHQVVKTAADGTTVEWGNSGIQALIVAASDETTVLTVADGKTEFQMPFAFTLTDVKVG